MFRQHPRDISDVLKGFLRVNGLETPLLQRRLIERWDDVVGKVIAQYTEDKSIRNQTLWVKVSSPAVRTEILMRRTQLVNLLNEKVGAQIIKDVRVY